jgi:hypothetical protein
MSGECGAQRGCSPPRSSQPRTASAAPMIAGSAELAAGAGAECSIASVCAAPGRANQFQTPAASKIATRSLIAGPSFRKRGALMAGGAMPAAVRLEPQFHSPVNLLQDRAYFAAARRRAAAYTIERPGDELRRTAGADHDPVGGPPGEFQHQRPRCCEEDRNLPRRVASAAKASHASGAIVSSPPIATAA